MKKTLLLLVALAALAVPAAAVAKTIEVKGPQAVAGRGFVRGELKMAKTDARPVALRFRAGYVRLIDLDDDLQVRCLKRPAQRGDGEQKDGEKKDGEKKDGEKKDGEKKSERQGSKPRESKNAKGQTVLTCIGGALVRGSHFQLSGFSMRFVILSPEGTTGSITGNVVTREPGEKKGDGPADDDDSDESGDADADESDAVAEIQTALAAQGK